MFLLGKKIKAKSIKDPLGNVAIPQKLPEKILEDLIIKLREGVATDREKQTIYEGHIRLAINIAGRYAHQVPHKTQDLVSEAMLAVGIAIRNVASGKKILLDSNFTPYCVAKIHSMVSAFVDNDRVVRMPQTTYSKAKRNGAELEPLKTTQRPVDAGEYNDEFHSKRRCRVNHRYRCQTQSNTNLSLINDMITRSVTTASEKKVIDLKRQEYTDKEVAQLLGKSVCWVGIHRRRVEERFVKLEKENV